MEETRSPTDAENSWNTQLARHNRGMAHQTTDLDNHGGCTIEEWSPARVGKFHHDYIAIGHQTRIRLVQNLWNLVGGIFVLKGGFHAPTEREQETLETDLGAGATPPGDAEQSPPEETSPNPAAVPSLNPEH